MYTMKCAEDCSKLGMSSQCRAFDSDWTTQELYQYIIPASEELDRKFLVVQEAHQALFHYDICNDRCCFIEAPVYQYDDPRVVQDTNEPNITFN